MHSIALLNTKYYILCRAPQKQGRGCILFEYVCRQRLLDVADVGATAERLLVGCRLAFHPDLHFAIVVERSGRLDAELCDALVRYAQVFALRTRYALYVQHDQAVVSEDPLVAYDSERCIYFFSLEQYLSEFALQLLGVDFRGIAQHPIY